MCGIAGFSLRDTSKVNARELSHELLKEIEWRGGHASGYAYQNAEGHIGYWKDAVPGSQLPLKTMPRSAAVARNVILHTRLATQGDTRYNENNHPVINPSGNIALVHNGVIWNDSNLRWQKLASQMEQLADVDSAIIGPLLEEYGFDGWEDMMGDAAVAWLANEVEGLNLARIEGNPINYTWLLDGSFVFASTGNLLVAALESVGLEHGAVFSMDEQDAFQVINGVIMQSSIVPRSKSWGYVEPTWRAMTSGGHGSEDAPTDKVGATFANHYDDESGEWSYEPDDEYYSDLKNEEKIAMAMLEKSNPGLMQPGDDEYYTIDHDGDMKTYATLEDLETDLKWWAHLHEGDDHYGAEGEARWVEHYVDVGSMDVKTGGLISFVDSPDELDMCEDFEHSDLGYVRDGVSYLKRG